jgi:endonuclease YncB( thermonuclease family)
MRFHKYGLGEKPGFGGAGTACAPASRLRNMLGGGAVLALLVIAAAALENSGFGATERTGQAQAIDGDSLRLNGVEMRLKGLDSPEYAQTCTDASGQGTACGKTARQALVEQLRHGDVTCRESEKDRYGRALVTCTHAGQDIGAELVRAGHAVAYGAYEREEAEARAARRGVWAGSFERPADWRRRHPRDNAPQR